MTSPSSKIHAFLLSSRIGPTMPKRLAFLSNLRDRIADPHLPSSIRKHGRSLTKTDSIPSTGGCNHCNAFIRMLNEELWQEHHQGLRTEIRFSSKSDCSICSTIRQSFRQAHGESAAQFAETEAFLVDNISPMMGMDVYFLWPAMQKEIQRRKGIYLLPLDVPEGQPPGRLSDPKAVDLHLVQRWIHCCDQWHAETCHSTYQHKLDGVGLLRVVDVQKQCLAYIEPGSRYFALSYVWGRVETLQTTRKNLEQLEQDGALSSGKHVIPRTIRDAIEVVSKIGERYLWIDALCIIQDKDSDEKPVLLGQMDKIYGNAYVTIVAAVGDNADAGLPGVCCDHPRIIPQSVLSYGDGRRLAISQSPFEHTLGQHYDEVRCTCMWNKRAWTLQERLLSRRKLIFLEEGVHFNCHSMTWTEDIAVETEETIRHFQMFDFEGVTDEDRWFSGISRKGSHPRKKEEYTVPGPESTLPSFVDYCNLVSNHLRREISFQEDILNAFQGILSSLGHSFGSFHYGLPETFFTLGLLWQPSDFCRRRIKTATKDILLESPSWSWAGWVCNVDVAHWTAACDYVVHQNIARSYRTTPATTFFSPLAGKEAQIEKWHFQILDDRMQYRSVADEPPSESTDHLPDGWERGNVKEHTYLGRQRFADFWHHSDPGMRFLYPIPTSSPSPTTKLSVQQRSRSTVLHFRSETATFKVSPSAHNYGSRRNAASILDSDGQWCGIAILHHEPLECDSPAEIERMFVKISQGEIFAACVEEDVFPEARFVRFWGSPEWYRYVNIIMVEQRESLMERVAVGRIREDVWLSVRQDSEDIYLT